MENMRPLYHPSVKEITVQGILYALSDPVRVQIYKSLMDSTCAQNCTAFSKAGGKPLAKSTLSQHFKILREAGLIRSERNGVELHNTPRCVDLQKRYGDMIEEILKAYDR